MLAIEDTDVIEKLAYLIRGGQWWSHWNPLLLPTSWGGVVMNECTLEAAATHGWAFTLLEMACSCYVAYIRPSRVAEQEWDIFSACLEPPPLSLLMHSEAHSC